MKLKHWVMFFPLGAIWSSSFTWIKIALRYATVRFWLKDNSLHLFCNEREISFTLLKSKPKSSRPLPRKAPPASHPWRRTGGKGPKTLLQKQNTKTLDNGRKSYVS